MKNNELLAEITIPQFIKEVQLSKARRAKYFYAGQKIPKKYSDKNLFAFKSYNITAGKVLILTDLTTNQKVIANSRVAGKPKMLRITGNSFYTGFPSFMIRDKVVDVIKESLNPYFFRGLKASLIGEFPLYLEFQYYDVKKQSQDIDNKRYIYEKCTLDLLQKLEIIPNDNIDYITKLSSEFFEVDNEEDRKLIVRFYSNRK